MNRKIIEKFFANQATREEVSQVLDWFETPEGREYLEERLNADATLMDRDEIRETVPELKSKKLFGSIQQAIRKENNVFPIRRTDWLGYAIKVAAVFLIILTAFLFAINQDQYDANQVVEREPIIFQTEQDQHRNITLGDGTTVRLNRNSKLVVSDDYLQEGREVTLIGEAYFDVEHNPDLPFVIHANQSSVEVLGTSFNVRSLPDHDNVQVAVIDGSVSFRNDLRSNNEELSVNLSKGQFGYLDKVEGSISVDEVTVENYLAWKSGQFNFKEMTLEQVCTQLNRIYDMTCNFENDEIKQEKLTANFSNDSIARTLSVIALSLQIEFNKEENRVYWYQGNQNST